MVYAQIKSEIVHNLIVLDDENLSSLFLEGYDHLIRVDRLPVEPKIGDIYLHDTGEFLPAPSAEEVAAALVTPEADTVVEQQSWWSDFKSYIGM